MPSPPSDNLKMSTARAAAVTVISASYTGLVDVKTSKLTSDFHLLSSVSQTIKQWRGESEATGEEA